MLSLFKFFGKWRSKSTTELAPRSGPICHAYYSDKMIFVCAVMRDITGMAPLGEPSGLFARDVEPETLGKAVRAALDGSLDGIDPVEGERQCKFVLGKSGMKSWGQLEKRCHLIVVGSVGDTMIRIGPMHKHRSGGYVGWEGDPVSECRNDPVSIGNCLRTLIDAEPLPETHDEPGHV